MKKGLLVVESPTKARTIGKYLADSFEVVATVGHFRDLPKSTMGVKLKDDWEIEYVLDPKKKEVISKLLSMAGKADKIFLASDPDREGEAIAYHTKFLISNDKFLMKKKLEIKRISFHEITKEAVEEALKGAREIDMNLVNAQQGRRVLDRVVGYSLSPVLWKKVRRGLSAGRVQSVAVRLIVEREKEIEVFKKEKFYRVEAWFDQDKKEFRADLFKVGEKSFIKLSKIKLFDGEYSFSKSIFGKEEEVRDFVSSLGTEFEVEKVEGREINKIPPPAFTTSKMQQTAARRFGWSGKQTMTLAQRLYEGGLITYHRTDSVFLSPKAVAEFSGYIAKTYGESYAVTKPRFYKNNSKNAQEAHEAIRPTKVGVTSPDEVDSKEKKLYELIWRRAVATQAAGARLRNTTVLLKNGTALFKAMGVKVEFDGYYRISGDKHDDQLLPELKAGDKIKAREVKTVEAETSPPPRYTDASLVGSMEKQGIGRPSTYAPIISTIIVRQYIEREEGKFKPTFLGQAVSEFLVTNFEKIVSLPFTVNMEESLDKIAAGTLDWKKMMGDFWRDFEKEIKSVEKNAVRVKIATEATGQKCPECKEGDLVIRVGRFGKFISCSRFPECKYRTSLKEDAGFKCPTCGAEGVVRRTKTGKKFFGCSSYPKCKWAGWKRP
ncbi:MAG: type I DNA topoisomerase [Patescibacteria group bacterium]